MFDFGGVSYEVGDFLKARLDDEAFVGKCGCHGLCHIVCGACEAYWLAECGEEAFALRRRFAAKTDSWCDCADDLCRLGRRDEAKSSLLEAREFVRGPECEEWSNGSDLVEKIAARRCSSQSRHLKLGKPPLAFPL